MRRRLALALVAGALIGCSDPPGYTLDAQFALTSDHTAFGGLSGMALSADGTRAQVVSDQGDLFDLHLRRDADQTLLTVEAQFVTGLRPEGGEKKDFDAEGMTAGPDGGVYISLERPPRVLRVDAPDHTITPTAPFPKLQIESGNKGLEALAMDPQGRLVTLPEQVPEGSDGFPLFRLQDGAWVQVGTLPAEGRFEVVGADFGPDNALYLLERAVSPLGFRTRLRRTTLTETLGAVETLMTSSVAQFDNLEALGLWQDDKGRTRVIMLSDDNFLAVQKTQIVELILQE